VNMSWKFYHVLFTGGMDVQRSHADCIMPV
jgi:hypothetical protein